MELTEKVVGSQVLQIQTSEDVPRVRQEVRRWAEKQGFGLVDQTKIVTAASELARNIVLYAKQGQVKLEALEKLNRKGLRLTFSDQGPGIADIEMAMRDGYTTGSGLGLGLGGAKRLVSEFHITSRPGEGTTVVLARWK